MISQLGLRISALFRKTAPDPFVLAILLTFVTAALALMFGFRGADAGEGVATIPTIQQRAVMLLDAWRADNGLWRLLAFAMQMCLILVTGHALATSKPVRRLIVAAAGLPRSCGQAAAMVALAACLTASLNWGLGLIVGAFLAREVGLSMSRRGLPSHYPLLVAAGYTGLMVWHGGFSGSAPLTMTSQQSASAALPRDLVEHLAVIWEGQWLSLDRTLLSPMNLVITGGLVLVIPLAMWLMAPRTAKEMRPAERFGVRPQMPSGEQQPDPHPKELLLDVQEKPGRIPEWLETSPVVAWGLAACLIAAMVRLAQQDQLSTIGLNQVNGTMFALGLLLHGSARSYAAAVEEAARGCAGIIIQFPLYAGIMVMMNVSGLVHMISGWFLSIGTPTTIPLFSFISAGVVNFFVPSGGGQWAVQGPIALSAGLEAGVDPAKMVMSVAYGDQLTNMLQPFWALPLLAITGMRARDIVGYTALAMMVGAVWIAFWLLVF